MQPSAERRLDPSLPGGIGLFFGALALLALLRIALGYVSLPVGMLPATNLVLSVLFLSVPILALFFASNSHWSWQLATAFVVGGLIVQFGLIGLASAIQLPTSAAGILSAIAQGALACWCVGLGALLATRIKEKNIMLPIAIFLAAYDFFLVLTPWGYGENFAKIARPILVKVAAQIPSVSATPTHGLAAPQAYVGMADLVFLAMFFVALFRFGMKTRATLYAVLPALVIYLVVVECFGNMAVLGISLAALPAMVPIGLAVLGANWGEFDLKRDERIATIGLAVIAVAFLTFAASRPKQPAAPSNSAPGPSGSRPGD